MCAWKDKYGFHLRIFRLTIHITDSAIIMARCNLLLSGINCTLNI